MQKQFTILIIIAVIIVIGSIVWGFTTSPYQEQTPAIYNGQNNEEPINNQESKNGDGEESEAITSDIDTSNWQTYRNEELGFEVRYSNDWPEPTLITDSGRDIVLFGPLVNREGREGRNYQLEIYHSTTKPKYHAFDEKCQALRGEVCIPFDPYLYSKVKETTIDGLKAYVSRLGDMLPQDHIFIQGKENSFLFKGGIDDESYYSVVLNFKEINR